MIQTGKVVEAKGSVLKVCFARPEMCAHCSGCGVFKENETTVTLRGNARVGDTVDVSLPEKQLLRHTLAAYMIPLGFLLAGVLLGTLISSSEILQALCGLALMGAGLGLVRLYDSAVTRKKHALPEIVAVHPGGSSAS